MAARPKLAAPPEQSALAILVDDYLASCRARGLAQGTIDRAYGFSLREIFLPWCEANEVGEAEQLTQRTLDRFTSDMYERGGRTGAPLSKHTAHTYIRHVRQFLGWAAKEGEVEGNAKPQLPRLPRRVVDVLSRSEIDQLEGAAKSERDKLIVRILADAGLRVGELCGLRADDVIRHDRTTFLKVRGKGEKERLVPLRPEIARRLERFIKYRSADARGDRLFVSLRRGHDGQFAPLTESGVGQLIRTLAYSAGLTKRVHPHLLRHSFATEALRRGMNPIQLSQILGHSSLRMIEAVYAHLNTTDAYEAMQRMFAQG